MKEYGDPQSEDHSNNTGQENNPENFQAGLH